MSSASNVAMPLPAPCPPRSLRRALRNLAPAAMLMAMAGCDTGTGTARPGSSPAAPDDMVVGDGAAVPMRPTATTSSSANGPAAPLSGLEGEWEGTYQAKKVAILLPPKVKDKSFEGDDGKIASGPGSVQLFVSVTGTVRGKVSGSLGVGLITGRAEDGALRTRVIPDDPHAPNAMSGTLVGLVKGDVIVGKLAVAVAGPDITLVREATIELARKRRP